MVALACTFCNWFKAFLQLLWSRYKELDETLQEASTQRPPQSLMFCYRMDPWTYMPQPLPVIFYFSSKTVERIWRNFVGRKYSMSFAKSVFWADRSAKMPPVICRSIFDFSSATTERNLTNLDRKQVLIAIYQYVISFSRTDLSIKMAALSFDWLRHFRLLVCNRWNKFDEKW